MKIILILSLIFFFGTSQKIFANECTDENITKYFLSQTELEGEEYITTYHLLKEYIENNKKFLKNDLEGDNDLEKIEEINERFIESQDKKFSLAIEYVLKKFEEEQEDFEGKKRTTEILEEFKTGSGSDFFIKNYLEKNSDPKNIPSSVLQKSVYLDFLIFSCELGEFGVGAEFKQGAFISDILSESDSKDFEKKEILEKQKIVVAKAVAKYHAFLGHREMYVALRGVVEKLEHLKRRFEDFARLIGFLPAKLVDFGYKGN